MLDEPQVPFPVELEHPIRPDMVKLEGPIFALDNQRPKYLAEKRRLLVQPWTSLLDSEAEENPSGVLHALDWLGDQMAEAHPLLREGVEKLFSRKYRATPNQLAHTIGSELGLLLQEDIALMHGTRLEAAWVCLPSRWDPAEKIGLDFAKIHVPVPNSQKLQAAQHNVAKAMTQKGPFIRYVWGLSYDPNLCQHPSMPRHDAGDTVYFRTERQITLPLPELNRSWFLIRVYNLPLRSVLSTLERKTRLAQALRNMTPEHIGYKNMANIIPGVLQELDLAH